MRITQRAVAMTSLQGLSTNLTSLAKLQQQLTSGKNFSTPSESPTGTNTSMAVRADLRAAEQHSRNISDANGWLTQTDTALQSMMDMTRKVRELALSGKNTGTASAATQAALTAEVTTLRDGLLGVANQNVRGRPLFGGVTGGTTAYDNTGAWTGNNTGQLMRRVSATETVRIDVSGIEAFGAPGNDLFEVAKRIATDISANPAALAGHLNDLDAIMEKMMTSLSGIGSRQARVENADIVNDDYKINLLTMLGENENVDLPKTIMNMEMQKVGYEAALAATAKALQPSLMDFLR